MYHVGHKYGSFSQPKCHWTWYSTRKAFRSEKNSIFLWKASLYFVKNLLSVEHRTVEAFCSHFAFFCMFTLVLDRTALCLQQLILTCISLWAIWLGLFCSSKSVCTLDFCLADVSMFQFQNVCFIRATLRSPTTNNCLVSS